MTATSIIFVNTFVKLEEPGLFNELEIKKVALDQVFLWQMQIETLTDQRKRCLQTIALTSPVHYLSHRAQTMNYTVVHYERNVKNAQS